MLNHLFKHQNKLQNKIRELQKKSESYPPEHLYIVKNGKYNKWFKTDGHTSTYIPKKDKSMAVELAHKKYDNFKLKEYICELELMEEFIKKYKKLPKHSEHLLNDTAFLFLYQLPSYNTSDTMCQWMKEKYDRNPLYPDQLQHKCLSGEFVRSKSEVIIANTLFINHIPYRYECALLLGTKTFYPDFTIMLPGTSKIVYWEHFGMMDVPGYCDKAFEKLKNYGQYHIIPDINLITTYETRDCPIDSERIQKIVHELLQS